MLKRILVAIPIIVVVALALFLQGWVLAIFAVALACMSQYEVVRAMDGNGKPVVKTVSFLFAGLLAALFLLTFWNQRAFAGYGYGHLTSSEVVILFVLFTMAALVTAMFSGRHKTDSVSNTVLTFVYPQLFFVLFYLLILGVGAPVQAKLGLQDSYLRMLLLLLMVFLPAMFTDTFAYFFGMAFGKRKLCPQISPKKTVAGCVAGIAGGIVAAVLIWLVFDNMIRINGQYMAMPPLLNYAVAGGILAVVSQLGDLSASFLKRALGIKDFGKLLPGHGGVVDRVDSVMFCIPVVYILSMMIMI